MGDNRGGTIRKYESRMATQSSRIGNIKEENKQGGINDSSNKRKGKV